METNITYIESEEHYQSLVQHGIMTAKESVWISTANVKDMHVEISPKKHVSILRLISDLNYRGIMVRILHSGVPTENFLKSFRKFRDKLIEGRFVMRR